MTLLQPSYLWGLLSLAIPIAIHLWSRRKVHTIKVGSTQFIAQTRSTQSNSLSISEWWLLVLRCLTLGILTLILAGPQLQTMPEHRDIAYVFEPSLLTTLDSRALFKNIPAEGRYLLVNNFPEWENDEEITENTKPLNYWQLAQQLGRLPADSIVIFTQALQKGLKGKRPTLSKNINWIPVAVEDHFSYPVRAIAIGDSITTYSVEGDQGYLAFAKAKQSLSNIILNNTEDSIRLESDDNPKWVPFVRAQDIDVTLVYNKAYNTERLYLEAALRAIEVYTKRTIKIRRIEEDTLTTLLDDLDYLLWLNDSSVPNIEKPMLTYAPDDLAYDLIENTSQKGNVILTQRLTPRAAVEKELAYELLKWMRLNEELEEDRTDHDRRAVNLDQIQTHVSKELETLKMSVTASFDRALWLILLLVLIIERALSRLRKQ